jgi:hypothetical protein
MDSHLAVVVHARSNLLPGLRIERFGHLVGK